MEANLKAKIMGFLKNVNFSKSLELAVMMHYALKIYDAPNFIAFYEVK
jgi:hypothetical protein